METPGAHERRHAQTVRGIDHCLPQQHFRSAPRSRTHAPVVGRTRGWDATARPMVAAATRRRATGRSAATVGSTPINISRELLHLRVGGRSDLRSPRAVLIGVSARDRRCGGRPTGGGEDKGGVAITRTEISLRFYSFAIPRSTRTRIVASGSAVRFNGLTFSGGGGGGSGSGSGSKANGRLPAPPHHPSRAARTSADGVHRPPTNTRPRHRRGVLAAQATPTGISMEPNGSTERQGRRGRRMRWLGESQPAHLIPGHSPVPECPTHPPFAARARAPRLHRAPPCGLIITSTD
jgi:hypothetical protein